jgi:hypothetical protein
MEQTKHARGTRRWLGLGLGLLAGYALGLVARRVPAWAGGRRVTASGHRSRPPRNAVPSVAGAARANRTEGDPMNLHQQPVHRERLYDSDERYRSAGYGEMGPGGAEPGFYGPGADPRGDFRHGGLGVQGRVAEAPHLSAAQPTGEGAPHRGPGGAPGGDFEGGFRTWGRVPEPPHAAGPGTGAASPDEDFDPDYLQWREEQLRSLDEDYRAWRQQKFADDFSQWRGRSSGRAG